MFVIIRALVYATLFIGLLLIYVPANILSRSGITPPASTGWEQLSGIVIGSIGAFIALWCVATFATVGKGTPAPFDPPRKLVERGPYRYVRNPMYIGAGVAMAGAALYFQSTALLGYDVFFLLMCHLFVIVYEERALNATFDGEYVEYCRRVNRWRPKRPVNEREKLPDS